MELRVTSNYSVFRGNFLFMASLAIGSSEIDGMKWEKLKDLCV
jgi:hypothetical protein